MSFGTKTPRKSTNPFFIPPAAEYFDYKENQIIKEKEEIREIQGLSLVERADLLRSPIPPCNSQRFRDKSRHDDKYRPKTERKERRGKMTDVIREKREIYIAQMVIDQKKTQISKIYKEIKDQEAFLEQYEQEMNDSTNKCKLETSQIEFSLAKARKSTESYTAKKLDFMKKLKIKSNDVAMLKTNIQKYIDLRDSYIVCKNFIERTLNIPTEKLPEPEYLLDFLNSLEMENLFISDQCSRLDELMHSGIGSINNQIEEIEMIHKVISKSQNSIEIPQLCSGCIDDFSHRESEQWESEIDHLTLIIHKLFTKCFKDDGKDLSALVMLAQLENTLEDMYRRVDFIEPSFVTKKMQQMNKAKREKSRKMAMEAQVRALAEKKEQALLRAQREVKRNNGRPVIMRTVPKQKDKRDDLKAKKLLQKQLEQEIMLFGNEY